MNINRIPGQDENGQDARSGDGDRDLDGVDANVPRILCRDHYLGFLAWVDATDGEGGRAMAGAECTIGSRLSLEVADDGTVTVLSPRNTPIGNLPDDAAAKVISTMNRGWEVVARLELVGWDSEEDVYSGEIAIVCHDPSDPEIHAAVTGFSSRLATRIRGGDHPTPCLSQGEFEKVVESGGQWCLTKMAPLPSRKDGIMVFRRRQTFTDRLVESSMEHRAGCTIATFALFAAIVVGVVALVMFLF